MVADSIITNTSNTDNFQLPCINPENIGGVLDGIIKPIGAGIIPNLIDR